MFVDRIKYLQILEFLPDSGTPPCQGHAQLIQRAQPGTIRLPVTSVVRQSDAALSKTFLARMTFAKMSDAFVVQMKGLGSSLW